jgi:hypothetical protein
MSDQDTSQPGAPRGGDAEPEPIDRSDQTDAEAEPARPETGTASGARGGDDRNDELDESPAPDPEEKAGEPTAEDDPQAD